MKKLYMIITLFVSSFFLFNSDVKAEEYNYNFKFDYLPEDFTEKKELVDNFIKEDTSLSNNYIIRLSITGNEKAYYVIFVDNPTSLKATYSSGKLILSFTSSYIYKTIGSNNLLGNNVNSTSSINLFINGIYQNYILYANFDILTNNDNHTINFISDDYTKTFQLNGSDKLPTIYDMYLEKNNIFPENPHQEEIQKVGNFYTLCIEKLAYLGDKMVSNYIYLSIFAIFIFIFVVELIRRRCI